MEAHACDEWRMGQPRDIPQHTTLAERAAACKTLCTDFPVKLPIALDAVTKGCGKPEHGNRCGAPNFERLYGAWPLRFLIFAPDGTLLLKAMPVGELFDFDDIDRVLQKWIDGNTGGGATSDLANGATPAAA